jgi:hypothetical protein
LFAEAIAQQRKNKVAFGAILAPSGGIGHRCLTPYSRTGAMANPAGTMPAWQNLAKYIFAQG